MINAILLSRPDEESKRRTLISWFRDRDIKVDENLDTEELRNIYISIECGGKI